MPEIELIGRPRDHDGVRTSVLVRQVGSTGSPEEVVIEDNIGNVTAADIAAAYEAAEPATVAGTVTASGLRPGDRIATTRVN